jgi:hypothetical protein
MVTLKNTDTGELVDIQLIDPKTGTDWSQDFFGNYSYGSELIEAKEYQDEEGDWVELDYDYEGDTEEVEWWVDFSDAYQEADDTLYAAIQENISSDDEETLGYIYNTIGNAELSDQPSVMMQLAEDIS